MRDYLSATFNHFHMDLLSIAGKSLGNSELSPGELSGMLGNSPGGTDAELSTMLRKKVAQLSRNGGRGVELADEIDVLRVNLAVRRAVERKSMALSRRVTALRHIYIEMIQELFEVFVGPDRASFDFGPFITEVFGDSIDVHGLSRSDDQDRSDELCLVAFKTDAEGSPVKSVYLDQLDFRALETLIGRVNSVSANGAK